MLMGRARGFLDLVFDLVDETTGLVERTHDKVVRRSVDRWVPTAEAKAAVGVVTEIEGAISGGVFRSIRIVNGITRTTVSAAVNVAEAGLEVESGFDGLATPVASNAAGTPSWYVDYLQASINGFWGDYLNRRGSDLDLGMTLRKDGRVVALTPDAMCTAYPQATGKVCVFVHGLATTEWLWSLDAEEHYGDPDVTFGTRLRDDLGYTPVYVRYNSGRHISENGRALATLLTEAFEAYPVPVEEVALVGHSMGGLVARSAAHYAHEHGEPWAKSLRHVACIGAPHLGAPLEKAIHVLSGVLRNVEAAGAQVPAELLDARSAGVKDLRYGYTVDEEWAGRDPDAVFDNARRNVPLVDGVGYYFLAATASRDLEHPLGHLVGDLLVRVPSASGADPEPARRIHFADGAVFPGKTHVQITSHPEVYEVLRDLLSPRS